MVDLPKPKEFPRNFTAVSAAYRGKVLLAVLGILLFIACYIAMVVAFAFLFHYAVTYPMGDVNRLTVLLKTGAVSGSAMLLFFGIKFLFSKAEKPDYGSVEITSESDPEFYGFIMNLAKEANAPLPKKISVNNDVNAFVYYHNTVWSLFLPTRKNLMIGMGLMNGLNLSELKAVLAHEFGHFSQSSMRVGSYVYMANSIIHDMVFTRDKWDQLLGQWRKIDIRLSFMAWAVTPIVWLVRQFMVLFYKLLNLLHASLSREMEFHADKVAVSLTGSDAIVNALWKLEYVQQGMNQAYHHAFIALQQKKYTTNLYSHHTAFLQKQKVEMAKEEALMPPDSEGTQQVFSKEQYSSLGMYASHPSSYDREKNAKTPYVSLEMDERAPAMLFQESVKLQEALTQNFYLEVHQVPAEVYAKKASVEVLEEFIANEQKDMQLYEQDFMRGFTDRLPALPQTELLQTEAAQTLTAEELKERFASLVGEKLRSLMKPVTDYDKQLQLASEIAEGNSREKRMKVGSITYNRKNIGNAINFLSEKRQKYLEKGFDQWDHEFYQLNYLQAREIGRGNEYLDYLRYLADIGGAIYKIAGLNNVLVNEVNAILAMGEVSDDDLIAFRRRIGSRITAPLRKELGEIKKIKLQPLANLANQEEFQQAVTGDAELPLLSAECFKDGALQQYMGQVDTYLYNLRRVQLKVLSYLVQISGLSAN